MTLHVSVTLHLHTGCLRPARRGDSHGCRFLEIPESAIHDRPVPEWPTIDLASVPTEIRLGGAGVYVNAHANDVVIGIRRDGDPLDLDTGTVTPDEPPEGLRRFVFGTRPASVSLQPRLADRAVVARPLEEVTLPPGQTVHLYVSTPLWVVVQAEETTLLDVALHAPRETWIGPSTTEGEFCYASRTRAETDLSALPVRPNRAITHVKLENAGDDGVALDRVRLPMPLLQLGLADDRFVTQGVRMTRTHGGLGDVRPDELPEGARPIGEPREKHHDAAWRHAFATLWRQL